MYKQLIKDLISIFNNQGYLNVILDSSIKSLQLNEHDKKLYTKILYGVVENKILLDYKTSSLTKGKRLKPFVRNALRIGTYCIDELNLQNHFIVNELVQVVKKQDLNASKLLNFLLREYLRNPAPKVNLKGLDKVSTELSIPFDLCKLLYEQYHQSLYDFFKGHESYNAYRITNYDKDCIKQIKKQLIDEGYNLNDILKQDDDVIICKQSLLNHELFKTGKIIAQDYASSLVAHIASPKKGDNVLDACAAPGGKSLHMASLMKNCGHITSCDIYETKLKKIEDNANKLNIKIIEPLLADATSFIYPMLYDVVLADVPCSGLGVINHKPDIKYHLTINDIKAINELQKKILNHVKEYVKPNGYLVYSTCTINKDENERLITSFLKDNTQFTKVEEHIYLPNEYMDGFYICKMRKEA